MTIEANMYQLINIHQRTKTDGYNSVKTKSISLSISIREPKHGGNSVNFLFGISLSISIREPKLSEQ